MPGLSPEEQAVVQKLLADPALMKSYGLTATAAPPAPPAPPAPTSLSGLRSSTADKITRPNTFPKTGFLSADEQKDVVLGPQSQQPLDAPGPAKQVELTVRSMGEQSEQPKEKKKEKK